MRHSKLAALVLVAGLASGCHSLHGGPEGGVARNRIPSGSKSGSLAQAAQPPEPAPVTTPTSAVVRELHVGDASKCQSEAEHVSINVTQGKLVDILGLLSTMSGMTMTCEACPEGLVVTGAVSDVPWDCVVSHLAEQAGLTMTVGTDTVVLAPNPR